MTPKEKAKELVDRFKADTVIYTWDGNGYKVDIETSFQNAKNCALICVDEILETINNVNPTTEETFESYWIEVKQEIEKL